MQSSALAIATVLIAIGALLSLSPRTVELVLQRPWSIPFFLPALLERFWIYSQIGVLRFRIYVQAGEILCLGAVLEALRRWRAPEFVGEG